MSNIVPVRPSALHLPQDAASTAAAVAFERKRASVDLAAAPLHGLSGLLGGSQHHHHHSQGMGGKGVIGPANPRE